MERILRIDSETRDLGTMHIARARDIPGLLAITVQRERYEVRGRELDGVPLEHDARLRGVEAAELRRRRFGGAERREDVVLEGLEGEVGGALGGCVAGDGDVDDAARGDVGWEEDGGEFNLRGSRGFSMLRDPWIELQGFCGARKRPLEKE